MMIPPRKVKPSVSLKNIHAEQTSKLQSKHQQECDILEDIRTFFKQKSTLEKEYAQGLLKVTTQLLKRDFPAQPDIASEDGLEHKPTGGRTVPAIWRRLLEEADKQAKVRLQAAEIYSEKIAEPIKTVKASKAQCTKKVMPQLAAIQAELAQTVVEMVKAQKTYVMEETTAHDARSKVAEAEDKLKRKSPRLFQSMAGLQKTCAKLQSRREACDARSTATRNEYLLSLASANAHQIRFYSTDLPDLMKTLDCDIYERIQEYLVLAGSTAADICRAEYDSFSTLAEEAEKISRQFSLQCYLFQNQVFTNLVQYQFEPCLNDQCNKVSGDYGVMPELEKEARKCATRVAKETKMVRDLYRQLTQLHSRSCDMMSESSLDENKSNGQTAVDPEQKMEEFRQNIRKSETAKMKAEARLEALRVAGINVDEWLNQAHMDSLTAEENGMARTSSQISLHTESSGGHSLDDIEPTYTHYYEDDDDDFIDDAFTSHQGNRFGKPFPICCRALYDFEASNFDEMSIKQHEPLELIADGDGEGWVKAINSSGQTGYIPENYVDFSETDGNSSLFVKTRNAINNVYDPAEAQADDVGTTPVETPTPGTPCSPPAQQTRVSESQSPSGEALPDTTSSYSSGDLEVQQTTEEMEDGCFPPPPPTPASAMSGVTWARALYDYEAQTQEELSFMEGALIKILRKDESGVDDGYWEGELNGRIGVFPSLVVEEVVDLNDEQDVLSPLPNDYGGPPPVTVTMPTPDDEPPPPPSVCLNGAEIPPPGTPQLKSRKNPSHKSSSSRKCGLATSTSFHQPTRSPMRGTQMKGERSPLSDQNWRL
ncbi:F-BAR and double SH3 domains protein 2-like isoform X2 [Pomacea canaliculata]|uniref:F-BAR and double SH3 domains protein 2-like isoform X2 n=1 Tax=Pomacea canaliculata TaxID=400727 RepID=UPI000D72CE3E|nr:F-BAR and double SH3 domains protein 2-like isoform X2 [Pomacea canaliculata]